MNPDFLAALKKVLSASDAKAVSEKFHAWGYSLTREYTGSGDHLMQSDDQMDFLIRRLLRTQTPLKKLDQLAAYDVFRQLSREHGYRIALPKGPLPNVP